MYLGRVAGFRLSVHWSTLVVFGLLTWSLAASRLPDQAPGSGDTAYLIAALVLGLTFFGSLLAHELGHALVARRHGVEVDGLTLWLLGGVAHLRDEARSPRADLQIAGVGPAVSLGLAATAALVAAGLQAVDAPALLVAAVGWLAGINATLAAFNLLPAAPLDGGRVLRAVLWRWRGDRTWAVVAAARAGEVLGYGLAGLGLADLLLDIGTGGLWFVLLGWFVLNAARTEASQALVRDRLGDLKVSDVMGRDPVRGPSWFTVAAFLEEYTLRTRYSAFPVESFEGRVQGLVTLRRLKAVPVELRSATRVIDVACPIDAVTTAAPDEPLVDLLPRLAAGSDGRALVLDGERLVGIVSPSDLMRAIELADLRRRQASATPGDRSPGLSPPPPQTHGGGPVA